MKRTRDTTHRKSMAERRVDLAYQGYLAAGLLVPLLKRQKREQEQGQRSIEGICIGTLLARGIKAVVPERRPDSQQQDSFPSSHTLNAFVVATTASVFARDQASLWYAGAVLVGLSRLAVGRHRTRDVLAGALLGYGAARLELSHRKGPIAARILGSVVRRR